MKMEQAESSETSAYKIQTPGNYPEENIQHTEHGESLKSRNRNMPGVYQIYPNNHPLSDKNHSVGKKKLKQAVYM
jgi:hypothetical protein